MKPGIGNHKWMAACMQIAAVYNIVWGASVVLFPNIWFSVLGLEQPLYPAFWQCIGMIVGVYGIGYAIASVDPIRHWPIVLVGFLGKVFGPLGFIGNLLVSDFPLSFAWVILFNDLIWLVPFFLILKAAFDHQGAASLNAESLSIQHALERIPSGSGKSAYERSFECAVTLVFLRHSGCSFCRETLSDLSKVKHDSSEVVLISPNDGERTKQLAAEYRLKATVVGDKGKIFFRSFGLHRGELRQLFGLKVWFRGLSALLQGFRPGLLDGDGFQMPGVFVVREGKIVDRHVHQYASDRTDFCSLIPASS